MRILGVDPSLRATGLVLLDLPVREVVYRWIRPPRDLSLAERLQKIYQAAREVAREWEPDAAVMEAVIFHRNPATALKMGAVRGVLLVALREEGLDVEELSPTRVKAALTGFGRASKAQMARMVEHLLGQQVRDLPHDLTDAMAVAIAYALKQGVSLGV
ncbi:MAG: crossover junction endodeoxyribonuclease RuvC [Candidatus Hydrothermae bacterium]|nr:crossover junction endodeoxyribonuclease RuvC [Candidatus Hydrothermae bacterium]